MEDGQDTYWREINYATNSTPTAYPLAIRVYRAQAPQDSDFAIIQFTQTINGVVQPYGTFTISKGSQHGASVYDLDYVFQDTVTKIYTNGDRGIIFNYDGCSHYWYASPSEPAGPNTKARSASYGYIRNGNSPSSNPPTKSGTSASRNPRSAPIKRASQKRSSISGIGMSWIS